MNVFLRKIRISPFVFRQGARWAKSPNHLSISASKLGSFKITQFLLDHYNREGKTHDL